METVEQVPLHKETEARPPLTSKNEGKVGAVKLNSHSECTELASRPLDFPPCPSRNKNYLDIAIPQLFHALVVRRPVQLRSRSTPGVYDGNHRHP